jgi:hypothetical protein
MGSITHVHNHGLARTVDLGDLGEVLLQVHREVACLETGERDRIGCVGEPQREVEFGGKVVRHRHRT